MASFRMRDVGGVSAEVLGRVVLHGACTVDALWRVALLLRGGCAGKKGKLALRRVCVSS